MMLKTKFKFKMKICKIKGSKLRKINNDNKKKFQNLCVLNKNYLFPVNMKRKLKIKDKNKSRYLEK